MTTRSRWLIAVAGLAICASFGTAAAQTAPAGKVGGETNVGTAVTPDAQSSFADQSIAKMEVAATRVRHMLDEARRNKDVVKTTCLMDKLYQIQVALKSGRERAGALKSAIARGDTDLRNHEFAVMQVLRKRVDQLDQEANQCVGEELGLPGDTKVTYWVDPNIAPDDQGHGEDPGVVTYVPPMPASPFN